MTQIGNSDVLAVPAAYRIPNYHLPLRVFTLFRHFAIKSLADFHLIIDQSCQNMIIYSNNLVSKGYDKDK